MYFAYGHNTDTKEFKKRIPNATFVDTAVLPNYKLSFHTWADIERAEGEEVFGVVWKVPEKNITDLDWFEGLGRDYKRSNKKVRLSNGTLQIVFVYEQLLKPERPPKVQYVRWLQRGYKEHGLPMKQLNDALRTLGLNKKIPKRATRRRSYSRRS
jgi:gamma-glutamylcyclotransferase (GGCT)/AIG2-like uncharacterized protein YtfP